MARSCEDGTALLAAVEEERPDAVITDIRMPPSSNDEGILIAHALRETHPEIGVVVLSQYADPDYPLALLEGGSAGRAYLLKESIHEYFEREVRPHVPDAWINEQKRDEKDSQIGIVGYEIPLTRHFYKYVPPRPLEEIEAEIAGLEKDIVRMLREVVG